MDSDQVQVTPYEGIYSFVPDSCMYLPNYLQGLSNKSLYITISLMKEDTPGTQWKVIHVTIRNKGHHSRQQITYSPEVATR